MGQRWVLLLAIGARNHSGASSSRALLKREATALARRSGREVAVAAARYPTLQRLEGATKSVGGHKVKHEKIWKIQLML